MKPRSNDDILRIARNFAKVCQRSHHPTDQRERERFFSELSQPKQLIAHRAYIAECDRINNDKQDD